ncbi:MAG TPA: flavodoxin domain-containing protein, partial [Brevundimonas sp.]|nr:flavodoxin domain-containing protein [Brevundimonas sp.]
MTADPVRWLWAAVAVALWLGVIAVVAFGRSRARRVARARADALTSVAPGAERPFLVLHASQTGQAEELAWMTARSLSDSGAPVRVLSLGEISLDQIAAARAMLIVAATTGEGDPPDGASRFVRHLMSETRD